MSDVIEITREDLLGVLNAATAKFARSDAALKSFRFSYPAKSEEFDVWKHLREAWEQSDEELHAAREDLRDFDQGKFGNG